MAAGGDEQVEGRRSESMKTAVVGCDTRQGRPRPEFLRGRRVPELAKALLRAAA